MQNAIFGAQVIIFSSKITAFMSESRWQEWKNKFFFNNFTFFINFFLNEEKFYRVRGNHSCCLECMWHQIDQLTENRYTRSEIANQFWIWLAIVANQNISNKMLPDYTLSEKMLFLHSFRRRHLWKLSHGSWKVNALFLSESAEWNDLRTPVPSSFYTYYWSIVHGASY